MVHRGGAVPRARVVFGLHHRAAAAPRRNHVGHDKQRPSTRRVRTGLLRQPARTPSAGRRRRERCGAAADRRAQNARRRRMARQHVGNLPSLRAGRGRRRAPDHLVPGRRDGMAPHGRRAPVAGADDPERRSPYATTGSGAGAPGILLARIPHGKSWAGLATVRALAPARHTSNAEKAAPRLRP